MERKIEKRKMKTSTISQIVLALLFLMAAAAVSTRAYPVRQPAGPQVELPAGSGAGEKLDCDPAFTAAGPNGGGGGEPTDNDWLAAIKQLCLYQSLTSSNSDTANQRRQLIDALTRDIMASDSFMQQLTHSPTQQSAMGDMHQADRAHVRTSRTVSNDGVVGSARSPSDALNRLLMSGGGSDTDGVFSLLDSNDRSLWPQQMGGDGLGLTSRFQPMRGKRFVYRHRE